ncbi:MAG: hypothetical protein P1U56_10450 [Saprospiraceae bacterium]|nr:hypothetical protein [Saprospiraceae bacterium]
MKYILVIMLGWLSFFYYQHSISEQKLQHFLDNVDAIHKNMEAQIEIGETIASIKDRAPNFLSFEDFLIQYNFSLHALDPTDLYEGHMLNLSFLSYKMQELYSHSMMVLDKYMIKQDQISKELQFGFPTHISILGETEELFINDQKVDAQASKYVIPHTEVLKLHYNFYSLDHENLKIDTVTVHRNINLKAYLKTRES